ncbi:hypothetical protein GN316_13130 [Xylophilus sp. Kf1]|nr:hypothetical protein [Xylophilus sp. Kf1]
MLLNKIFGLDRNVGLTLVFRLWSVVAGLTNLAVIPIALSSGEQGYYYTYGSVIALQVFFELGLSQVITQFASHDFAHLPANTAVTQWPERSHQRLASIVLFMRKWYLRISVLYFIFVSLIGLWFFSRTGTKPIGEWAISWVLLVAASAWNLWLSPKFAFLEGCGQVGNVAAMRFVQSVTGYCFMWAAFLLGAGLNAIFLLPFITGIFGYLWLKKNGSLLSDAVAIDVNKNEGISWRKEIFPLQWRISLSWICSYLIFNLFTPFVFARAGEEEAGRLGMSLAVFSSITTIGMSWINAKAPHFSMLVSKRNFDLLNMEFKKSLLRSAAAVAVASVGFILVSHIYRGIYPKIDGRLVSNTAMFVLASVALANTLVFSAATYMRSFKREPMLPVSIVTGILSVAAIFFGAQYGSTIMLSFYAAVIILVCLPWTAWLFSVYSKQRN